MDTYELIEGVLPEYSRRYNLTFRVDRLLAEDAIILTAQDPNTRRGPVISRKISKTRLLGLHTSNVLRIVEETLKELADSLAVNVPEVYTRRYFYARVDTDLCRVINAPTTADYTYERLPNDDAIDASAYAYTYADASARLNYTNPYSRTGGKGPTRNGMSAGAITFDELKSGPALKEYVDALVMEWPTSTLAEPEPLVWYCLYCGTHVESTDEPDTCFNPDCSAPTKGFSVAQDHKPGGTR